MSTSNKNLFPTFNNFKELQSNQYGTNTWKPYIKILLMNKPNFQLTRQHLVIIIRIYSHQIFKIRLKNCLSRVLQVIPNFFFCQGLWIFSQE